MDPYLERHIRLAERRGLLRGRSLSQIQEFALEIALIMESHDRNRESVERLKFALVSNDPQFWVKNLWDRPESKDSYDLEDTSGEWIMPPISESEYLEFQKEMEARGGTISMDDLEADVDVDDGGWV